MFCNGVNAFKTCETRHVSDSQKFFYKPNYRHLKRGGGGKK